MKKATIVCSLLILLLIGVGIFLLNPQKTPSVPTENPSTGATKKPDATQTPTATKSTQSTTAPESTNPLATDSPATQVASIPEKPDATQTPTATKAPSTTKTPQATKAPGTTASQATKPPATKPASPEPMVDLSTVLTSADQVTLALRQQLKLRNTHIVVQINLSIEEFQSGLHFYSTAQEHTGVPTEGDYLRWHCASTGVRQYVGRENGREVGILEFTPTYGTTLEQEKAVDAEVKRILDELNVYNASDSNKVYAIYDYLCKNVAYADTYGDSWLQGSTYAALILKEATCQGYATAFYRLALELGVDNRLIAGYANMGPHGWNIVRLDSLYYNLDATFDAGRDPYKYYLKGQENFTSHIRQTEYDTAEFHQRYPMGTNNHSGQGRSGKIGDSIFWEIADNGALVISGQGQLPDSQRPWELFAAEIKSVEIRDGITRIGDFCFWKYNGITSVKMADSVTEIGEAAFNQCESLQHIEFSQKLQKIDRYAFLGTAVEKVVLPKTLTEIGDYAFRVCEQLKEVSLPDGLVKIGSSAFSDCTALTSIQIPKSVVSLGDSTFSGCTALQKITMSYNTTFGKAAFKYCSALEAITPYPGEETGFNHAPEEAFYGCSALRSIQLVKASVGERAFQDCTSLESVSFMYSGYCETDAFLNCTAIKSVYILNKSNYAIINFSNKESNPLHNGAMLYDQSGLVTHIDYRASFGYYNEYSFYGCQSLTSVHIDSDEVGEQVFANCSNLKYVTMNDKPTTMLDTHNDCWLIDEGAFMNCTALEWIEFGNGLSTVRETAFSGCTKLTTVYLNAKQSHWDDLCRQAPALKAATVYLNAKAPADRIDNQCESCKRVEQEKEEDIFIPEGSFWR